MQPIQHRCYLLVISRKRNVRLSQVLVRLNENGEFLASIINANPISKTINFSQLKLSNPSEKSEQSLKKNK